MTGQTIFGVPAAQAGSFARDLLRTMQGVHAARGRPLEAGAGGGRPGGRSGRRARRQRRAVHPETVRRIERSMGTLGTAAIAAMDERLPWFRKMTAENRSWLGLVAQAGIASFVDWVKHPERMRPAATEVFGTAPRELARAVRLQQAVEMVRVIIDVVEGQVDDLAAPGGGGRAPGSRARLRARDRVQRRPGVRADRRGARRLGRPA